MQEKEIISINGSVIKSRGEGDFAMHDMVYVGENNLIGEVIKLDKDVAVVQVYEETAGLKIGEKVFGSGEPLSIELGPGLVGNVFDGIERPLEKLQEATGVFIGRGINISPIDEDKVWHFIPIMHKGQVIRKNTVLGEVIETESIRNRIMNPFEGEGELIYIAGEGEYRARDIIAKYMVDGKEIDISMVHKWPVRKPRPYMERIDSKKPLITGQRVIDTLFPIAKGGTAMIPGGFGTGKTMLQHQMLILSYI